MIDTIYTPVADASSGTTAFCQNCGKALTAATSRVVGPAVYCEPCLAARMASGPAGPGYAGVPPAGGAAWASGAGPATRSLPNPGLAALLGFIPGVGAMYNEQYAKGIVHLMVFATLIVLTDSVNGIFGLFIAGWEFYMAIEAHHTARARRDHTILPNPFGLNDVGERLGFGKAWPGGAPNVASVFHDAAQTAAAAAQQLHAHQQAQANQQAHAYQQAANQANYQPWGARPQQPSSAEAPPFTAEPASSQNGGQPYQQTPQTDSFGDWTHAGTATSATHEYAQNSASGTQEPWRNTFQSAPPPAPAYGAYPPYVPAAPTSCSRFPAGAVWLIGAGVFFLVTTTGMFSFLRKDVLIALGLLALAAWMFVRRMLETGATVASDGSPAYMARALRACRGSAWVGLTGFLFLLSSLHILGWNRSWPLYIILGGVLGFLERAAQNQAAAYQGPPAPPL